MCQFFAKKDNFEFFSAKIWRNCPTTCNILVLITCVAESWVEAEMSWVEVGGDGCSYVEVGVWFSNTCFNFIHCVKRDIEIA